ncbi:hypothetical protein ACFO27_00915 [Castellaniella denitrificans]|uniref:hypothetical protein n=1 Tax=Castellaniella denitrificans TaxID=56119 RepID=UPI003619AFA4
MEGFREDVRAAAIASTLGLKSVDYAKKRYGKDNSQIRGRKKALGAYLSAYQETKKYVVGMMEKFNSEGCPDPSNGAYGASLALERLLASFFAVNILYRLGNNYEGHAVARLVLEQIAWAYAAYEHDDLDVVSKLGATQAISQLKSLDSRVGRMYGFLSKKTHIDYSSHFEFITIEDEQVKVLHAQPRFDEYGRVLFFLADMFGLVWEITQAPYIKKFEAITLRPGPKINPKRPFVGIIRKHLSAIDRAMRSDGYSEIYGREGKEPIPGLSF